MASNRREDVLPVAARTATVTAPGALNMREDSGILVVVEVTATGGANAITASLLAPAADGGGGTDAVIWTAGFTFDGVGRYAFQIYPFGSDAAPSVPSDLKERFSLAVPEFAKLKFTVANATSKTYSVRVYYLP